VLPWLLSSCIVLIGEKGFFIELLFLSWAQLRGCGNIELASHFTVSTLWLFSILQIRGLALSSFVVDKALSLFLDLVFLKEFFLVAFKIHSLLFGELPKYLLILLLLFQNLSIIFDILQHIILT